MNAYLATSLLISLMSVGLLFFFPHHRSAALVLGLCSAPVGAFDALFSPEYWTPPHVLRNGLSLEGFLFSFGNGILIWLAAAVPFGSIVHYRFDLWRVCKRLLACFAIAISAFAAMWRHGLGLVDLPVMDAGLLATIIQGGFVLGRRPDAWPLAVTGSVGFTILYSLELFVAFKVFPNQPEALWSPAVMEGVRMFGVPAEEFVWAFVFGAVHPVSIAWCADAYLDPDKPRPADGPSSSGPVSGAAEAGSGDPGSSR